MIKSGYCFLIAQMGVVSAGGASNEPASGSVTVVYKQPSELHIDSGTKRLPESEVFCRHIFICLFES